MLKDEQQHDALVERLLARVIGQRVARSLLDYHRLADVTDIIQHRVDLPRTDVDAAYIQHSIETAMHPRTALRRKLDKIAVRPDAWVGGEIGSVESRALGVAEETKRT